MTLLEKAFLVFPPLPAKYRFLIHETASQLFNDTFSTVSIGKDNQRRLVIFSKVAHDKLRMSENGDTDEVLVRKDTILSGDDQFEAKSMNCAKKHKRPDKPLYIPPGSKNNKSTEYDSTQHEKSESPSAEKNEPSWDSIYDDNGDALDNEFLNDLNSELQINAVTHQLATSKLDYTQFEEPSSDCGPCGNILEVYDFASDLKTRQLVSIITATL